MTAVIITLGAIVITSMIIGYLMWRYGVDQRIIKMIEKQDKEKIEIYDKVKQLESKVDSINTKVGARKI